MNWFGSRVGASCIVAVPSRVAFVQGSYMYVAMIHISSNYTHQPAKTCFENESRRDLEPLGIAWTKADVSGFDAFWDHPPDHLGSPSKEAESCGGHEDTP